MAITGHSGGNGDMSRRYDQVDDADLLKAVEKKNPVRGGVLTGSVGGGNEGKEVTSFRLAMYKANLVPVLKVRVLKQIPAGRV